MKRLINNNINTSDANNSIDSLEAFIEYNMDDLKKLGFDPVIDGNEVFDNSTGDWIMSLSVITKSYDFVRRIREQEIQENIERVNTNKAIKMISSFNIKILNDYYFIIDEDGWRDHEFYSNDLHWIEYELTPLDILKAIAVDMSKGLWSVDLRYASVNALLRYIGTIIRVGNGVDYVLKRREDLKELNKNNNNNSLLQEDTRDIFDEMEG